METLKMPMREIGKKYTISDIYLQAWDSRQKAYAMHIRMNKPPDHNKNIIPTEDGTREVPVPNRLVDERGELDLRKATGPEAVAYMQSIGIQFPAIMTH